MIDDDYDYMTYIHILKKYKTMLREMTIILLFQLNFLQPNKIPVKLKKMKIPPIEDIEEAPLQSSPTQ